MKDTTISDAFLSGFRFWFGVVATNCLTGLSMLTNLANMILFVKQGLRERVNFSLFCLSVTDFMAAAFTTSVTVAFHGDVWLLGNLIDGSSYMFAVGWGRNLFVDMSTSLTVFITVERCTCVVSPFTFNTSIMARKTKSFILAISLLVFVNYIPVVSTIRFIIFQDPKNNSTIWAPDYSELYVTFQITCDFLLGIVLTTSCQIGVFVCAILMYRGLRKTSKIRCPTKVCGRHGYMGKVPTLSHKERRVVSMILALAITYLVSTTPQTLYCWIRVLVKEMATDENQHLGLVLVIIVIYATTAYGACSAFIYYNFSSGYRSAFNQCFRF